MKNFLKTILLYNLLLFDFAISQNNYNRTFVKKMLIENEGGFIFDKSSHNDKHGLSLNFNQYFYINSNLPNLENLGGFYIHKGYGAVNSLLIVYKNKYLEFTSEPLFHNRTEFQLDLPKKNGVFSVLNDNQISNYKPIGLKNNGLKIKHKGYILGYGNWNRWWGPGIHNSLTMSNNANGFYNLLLGTDGFKSFTKNIRYYFEYYISSPMKNFNNDKFYLTSFNGVLNINNIDLGFSKNILSGGYTDINWRFKNAAFVVITNDRTEYWDSNISFYINYKSNDKLIAYLEVGLPNRKFGERDPKAYSDHGIASIIGFRKYGAFNKETITIGFEYSRLVQSIYYNDLPSPNWYDNKKYNYSSYNMRRWAAHSGSDSDDFLIYIGSINKNHSLLYGVNYERHGVTYNFPPEVKLESRISYTYKNKNFFMNIIYEDEYFKHYGFVDDNKNVWSEIFENNSIQRTKTLLVSIEFSIF